MNKINKAVCTAIDNALTCRTREPRFRVFLDGAMNYKACIKVAKEWVPGREKPYLQLREILGEGAVLSINQIASWSHEVRDAVKNSELLIDSAAISGEFPIIDTYSFISSSKGDTAFGAHIDFEDSIIIDLDGAGRRIRTWPVNTYYGEILPGSPTHFGTSFCWEEYADRSTVQTLRPGQIAVIKAKQPHIFHADGAGFFFGLSTLPKKSNNNGSLRPLRELVDTYPFLPVNDNLYIDKVLENIDIKKFKSDIDKLSITGDVVRYKDRKFGIFEDEKIFFEKVNITQEDIEHFEELVRKIIRLGIVQ